eukprot:9531522-Alexandrium_andersonii.AAC.1
MQRPRSLPVQWAPTPAVERGCDSALPHCTLANRWGMPSHALSCVSAHTCCGSFLACNQLVCAITAEPSQCRLR